MSDSGLAARRAALKALADVEIEGRWSTLAVPDRVADLPQARDRALASHLAYDTMRWEGTLDWALALVCTRPIREIEPGLLRVLRLGALQLLKTRVPARAVVDTSVTLARETVPKARAKGAAGFVNGVLRGLARQQSSQAVPWPKGDEPEAIGIRTAHPVWIVKDAIARFGPDAEAVLEADNLPPGLTLRANIDSDVLLAELVDAGLDASAHGGVVGAIRVPGGDPRQIAAVQEGRAVPQDAASMLVTLALDAQPGDHCLDLCAGPGGKTTHLASLVGPLGSVSAVELHRHRAGLIRQSASKQGLDNVATVVADARSLGPDTPGFEVPDGGFDRVLVDAPCTGLGVGRRRPEVRWRRTAQDAASLAELQVEILSAAASHVRAGGRLVYAVCTWTRAETEGVVQDPRVLAALTDFGPPTIRQLRPDLDDSDGMFIATYDRT